MAGSRWDWFYRRFIVTNLFTKGWGNPDNMKRIFHFRKKLSKREVCRHLVPDDYPVYIDKEVQENGYRLLDGHFMSPFVSLMPGIMPKEVEIARFQLILPTEWKTDLRPICLNLGGTGDHGFGRRRNLIAKPLLQEEGIASLILENPYYGCRKPKHQFRSSLQHVSDLFVMGGGLILESLVLFNWLDKQGYGPLGATGISMGGHMASLAATSWHKPLSLIPCMSWSTASNVFTNGVLSSAIPWKVLQEQFADVDAYHKEISGLIESPEPYWEGTMYKEGTKFVHDLEDSPSDSDENKNTGHSPFHIRDSAVDTDTQNNQSSMYSKSLNQISSNNNLVNTNKKNQSTKLETHKNLNQSAISQCNQSETVKSCESGDQSISWKDSVTNSLSKVQSLYKSSSDKSGDEKIDRAKEQLEADCRQFMMGVMDECTHLGNFSVPVDPELIVIVAADHDAYIPRSGVLQLNEIWPGSTLRLLPRGHISGFLFERKEFRKAIADSFQMQINKYYQLDDQQCDVQ